MTLPNPLSSQSPRPSGFNAFAAGDKVYGMLRSAPNIGPSDPMGYMERTRQIQARKDAIMRRMKASVNQDFAKANLSQGSALGGGTIGI